MHYFLFNGKKYVELTDKEFFVVAISGCSACTISDNHQCVEVTFYQIDKKGCQIEHAKIIYERHRNL